MKTGCASRNEKITIYNNCPLDIEISKIAFNGAANGFSIVSAPLTPFTIRAGKTSDVEVKHTAVAPPSKKNAVLDIEHSFVQTSPLAITMTAQGTDKHEPKVFQGSGIVGIAAANFGHDGGTEAAGRVDRAAVNWDQQEMREKDDEIHRFHEANWAHVRRMS